MKVELHLHTTRYSGCAAAAPQELMRRLIETGYEAVYITEHHSVWDDEELRRLQGQFPQIRIFPGVELTLEYRAFQHLLVLGTNDPAYLAIRDEADVLEKSRADGHLTVLAHPYRWGGADEMLKAGLLPDALEYQTPNLEAWHAAQAMATAQQLDLPLVNSGDVHALDFIDCFWIETSRPIESARDIRAIVLARQYENCAAGR